MKTIANPTDRQMNENTQATQFTTLSHWQSYVEQVTTKIPVKGI